VKKEKQEELELEAIRAMEDVRRDYSGDISVQFRAHLITAELRKVLGNTELEEAELLQAIELFSQLTVSEQWRWMDWIVDATEDNPIADKVKLIRSQLLQADVVPSWVTFMKSGLQKYKKGNLVSAAALFRQAEAAGAESVAIVLNLAQVEIELKSQDNNELSLQHWVSCLLRLNQLNFGAFSAKQHKRFKTLLQRYSDLQMKVEAAD
jgi:hypothetical protein